MTTVRRCAAALVATAVLCVAFAPAARAGGDLPPAPESSPSPGPSASPSSGPSSSATLTAAPAAAPSALLSAPPTAALPRGLYGTKDPAHDAVWRQSLAMLGQAAAGFRPADDAVRWLKGQQCANGAFPAYRADPGVPCDARTPVDSNSTAAAVQALSSLGDQRPFMARSVSWLRSVQNSDGGWGSRPGRPTDANSTSLVAGALASAGVRPGSVRSVRKPAGDPRGRNAYDALVALAIPCGARSGADAGAFAHRPAKNGGLTADDGATAAAVLGGIGKRLVSAPVKAGPAPACVATKHPSPERVARNGAAYLVSALAATGHLDRPPTSGADNSAPLPDIGNTAEAVVALTAAGYGDQATGALGWLKKNSGTWAQRNGPAAYAQLIFVAYATDTDPRNFGGIDLVERLNATGPAPKFVASPSPGPGMGTSTSTGTAAASEIAQGTGGGAGILWVLGVGLAAGAGIGFLLSRRGKTRRP
jgi:hypothetical protein